MKEQVGEAATLLGFSCHEQLAGSISIEVSFFSMQVSRNQSKRDFVVSNLENIQQQLLAMWKP